MRFCKCQPCEPCWTLAVGTRGHKPPQQHATKALEGSQGARSSPKCAQRPCPPSPTSLARTLNAWTELAGVSSAAGGAGVPRSVAIDTSGTLLEPYAEEEEGAHATGGELDSLTAEKEEEENAT
eukprot:15473565-Alexandrium_andersonii.AAC.1